MKKLEHRRRWSAWVLMAVFMPMLLLSSMHHHSAPPTHEAECYDCLHHIQHAGHITTSTHSVDNCVTCHLLIHTYLAGAVVATITLIPHILSRGTVSYRPARIYVCGNHYLRAPPVL